MNTHDIELPAEFRSGNDIPVTQATIKRERMEEIIRAAIATYQQGGNAKQRYDEIMKDDTEEPDPIEDLRFFCSLAMRQQDWLDVEPFFDALIADHKSRGEPVAYQVRCGVGEDWYEADQQAYQLVRSTRPCDARALYLAQQPAEPVKLDRYDAGYLGGQDGMPAYVWHDIIRSELDRAYDFYMDQIDRAAPQPAEPVKHKRQYAQGTALGEFGIIPMCDQVDDEPDEERLAMEAVDPATWPGLTPAQRCALGRFAKPQPAEPVVKDSLTVAESVKGQTGKTVLQSNQSLNTPVKKKDWNVELSSWSDEDFIQVFHECPDLADQLRRVLAEPVVAELPVKGKLHGPFGWIANATNPDPVKAPKMPESVWLCRRQDGGLKYTIDRGRAQAWADEAGNTVVEFSQPATSAEPVKVPSDEDLLDLWYEIAGTGKSDEALEFAHTLLDCYGKPVRTTEPKDQSK